MPGRCAVIAFLLVLPGCAPSPEASAGPDQVTVPLHIEGDRPFIDVRFRRPDGSMRSARFLLDTGGGGFLITEDLAREIGLERGEVTREEGTDFGIVTGLPEAFVGELSLALQAGRVSAVIGKNNILPRAAPGHAEGMIPGHVLARYHVVFDYPGRTFTLARPGSLKPAGVPLAMPVSRQMGFGRTEVEVDGATHGFLLDTGASFTMVSEVMLKSWGAAHPEWQRHDVAAAGAEPLGGQTLETMFVRSARWGPNEVPRFGVVSQAEGVFERYMSRMMTSPIVGALGGNVLHRFRLELDYANETLYLSALLPALR